MYNNKKDNAVVNLENVRKLRSCDYEILQESQDHGVTTTAIVQHLPNQAFPKCPASRTKINGAIKRKMS